jgi:hypothetical protein
MPEYYWKSSTKMHEINNGNMPSHARPRSSFVTAARKDRSHANTTLGGNRPIGANFKIYNSSLLNKENQQRYMM